MNSAIRRMARWVKGAWMQQDEMDAALDHLAARGFSPADVLDIGAAKGYWSLRAATRWQQARFHMIDPLAESETSLQQICRKHDRFTYLLTAVGDRAGTITMNVTPDLDGSSALDYPGADPARQRVIPVQTVDDLLSAGTLPPPQLVKIDVQGFEMQVLRGGQKLTESTEVFIIEANLYRFMPDCPLVHEVIAYMAERGYRVFDFAGSLRRPYQNDLAQVDVVFASEKSSLVASNRWA